MPTVNDPNIKMTYIDDGEKVSGILNERYHERIVTAFGIFRPRAKNKNVPVGFAPQVSLLRAI
jgi:hypothetical protein